MLKGKKYVRDCSKLPFVYVRAVYTVDSMELYDLTSFDLDGASPTSVVIVLRKLITKHSI
jgi:hypothetical protein